MALIAVIGTGLIGTSMALALKQAQIKNLELVGADRDNSALAGAKKRNAFDRLEPRLTAAVHDADMVILATPVMAMQDTMKLIGPQLKKGCVVTDVGSSKKMVLEWADQHLPKDVQFVGGHPMAGKETSGPQVADAGLFRGKTYCIVPSPWAEKAAVSEVTALAEEVGANPYFIGDDEHDSFVAAVSHLPFLTSVALVGCTAKNPRWEDIARVASTGYEGITRLASGDPVMHRDICVSNAEPIVAWIDAFIRELHRIRQLLDEEKELNGDEIARVFEEASDARGRWLAGLATSPQPFNSAELPTSSENIGRMFLGQKLMDAQKRFFGDHKGGGRDRT